MPNDPLVAGAINPAMAIDFLGQAAILLIK
jgi:hypothetical protein